MSDQPGRDPTPFLELLVPVLAFLSTFAAMALYANGLLAEIQYGAAGGFLGSCLLAYLAWMRPRKDIVALSTPLYGFIFLVTPIDYTGGVILQLLYACGLLVLTARLHRRFSGEGASRAASAGIADERLHGYLESSRGGWAGIDAAAGHRAAEVFLLFAEGEYRQAADRAHAAAMGEGLPEVLVRAFSVAGQHADLLERNAERPFTYQRFLPADAPLLAKPLSGSGDPDREFEAMMDNALLLLYSAAYHSPADDRPALLASQGFAAKLIGE